MTPLSLVLALACVTEEAPPPYTLLDPRQQLIRLSVDLRGVHPSEEELLAIEEDPRRYGLFVDRYLDDPRFLGRVREVVNERLLMNTGDAYQDAEEVGLGEVDSRELAAAIADEPLRLASWIVDTDQPWTLVATADHSMANPLLATLWGLDYPDGAEGWQPARYQDGRPHAGILTMTTTWQRYPSAGGNANRHRANAVSRMLLCDDYLSRPIVLNRAQVDQLTIDPEDAITTNESCQSCHSTLDPLAAHFFGFFPFDDPETLLEATTYYPENEEGWREYSGKPPAWYGTPTANLVELGAHVAADARFADCAVETFFQGFSQREATDADWTELQAYRDAFVAAGLRIKPLVRAIVTADAYLAADAEDPALSERLATVRTVSPAQLASIVEDVTGYRWTFEGVDGLSDPLFGLNVLSGGIDSRYVTARTYVPGVGLAYVQERLAQAAAWDVATRDLALDREGDAVLLPYVTVQDTPDTNPDAFDAQIRHLYLRVTGLPLPDDATEPARLMELWKQVLSVEGSPTAAWAAVIGAVLRDPTVIFY